MNQGDEKNISILRESSIEGRSADVKNLEPRSVVNGIPPLQKGEVHLWRWPLPLAWDYAPYLSFEEKKYAEGLGPKRRYEFWAGRAVRRLLLSSYLGKDLEEVFTHDSEALSKPSVPGVVLVCNLSHTISMLWVAVSEAFELGVDVEFCKTGRKTLALARRYFTPEEARYLESVEAQTREVVFYQMWTLKEAFLKCRGRGLKAASTALSRLAWEPEEGRVRFWERAIDAKNSGGRMGSICQEAPGVDYHFYIFSSEEPFRGALVVYGDAVPRVRVLELASGFVFPHRGRSSGIRGKS